MAIAIGTAIWMGVSALVSAKASNQAKRTKNQDLAMANMRRDISLEQQAIRQQEHLTKQSREIQEVAQRNVLRINQAAEQQAAHAEVNAAASGTTGQAIDLTTMAAHDTAGRQQGELARIRNAQITALEDKSRDINLEAELNKHVLDLDTSRTGTGIASLIRSLAFANQGFSV